MGNSMLKKSELRNKLKVICLELRWGIDNAATYQQ